VLNILSYTSVSIRQTVTQRHRSSYVFVVGVDELIKKTSLL